MSLDWEHAWNPFWLILSQRLHVLRFDLNMQTARWTQNEIGDQNDTRMPGMQRQNE